MAERPPELGDFKGVGQLGALKTREWKLQEWKMQE